MTTFVLHATAQPTPAARSSRASLSTPQVRDDPVAADQERVPTVIVTRSHGARTCPDAAELTEIVNQLNGRVVLRPAHGVPGATHVHVEVTKGLEGYLSVIRIFGQPQGERRLTDVGPNCTSLASALALTLAMTLEDLGEQSTDADAERSREPKDEDVRPQRDASRPGSMGPAVSAGVHVGVFPSAGPYATLLGRYARGRFSVALGALFAPEQTTSVADARHLELLLLAGLARPCVAVLGGSTATLALCTQPMLGWLRAAGRDFDTPAPPRSHIWAGFGIGATASGPIVGPLTWALNATGAIALEQRFLARRGTEREAVFVASPLAAFIEAGVRLDFE